MEAGYTGTALQRIPCIWQRNRADSRPRGAGGRRGTWSASWPSAFIW